MLKSFRPMKKSISEVAWAGETFTDSSFCGSRDKTRHGWSFQWFESKAAWAWGRNVGKWPSLWRHQRALKYTCKNSRNFYRRAQNPSRENNSGRSNLVALIWLLTLGLAWYDNKVRKNSSRVRRLPNKYGRGTNGAEAGYDVRFFNFFIYDGH